MGLQNRWALGFPSSAISLPMPRSSSFLTTSMQAIRVCSALATPGSLAHWRCSYRTGFCGKLAAYEEVTKVSWSSYDYEAEFPSSLVRKWIVPAESRGLLCLRASPVWCAGAGWAKRGDCRRHGLASAHGKRHLLPHCLSRRKDANTTIQRNFRIAVTNVLPIYVERDGHSSFFLNCANSPVVVLFATKKKMWSKRVPGWGTARGRKKSADEHRKNRRLSHMLLGRHGRA